jgi:hypothetical protein
MSLWLVWMLGFLSRKNQSSAAPEAIRRLVERGLRVKK